MANDTLPMDRFFPLCARVLEREKRPLHYARLTELALQAAGLTPSEVCWRRQIEDVREKLLEARGRGTFYVGSPHCLGALRWWFEPLQLASTPERIPVTARAVVEATVDALSADPYLKVGRALRSPQVVKARAAEPVMKRLVAAWFAGQWPEAYRAPGADWRSHDFTLAGYTVEVAAAHTPKSGVDLCLVCDYAGGEILWTRVVANGEGDAFHRQTFEFGLTPTTMAVWLNCRREGIDYELLKQSAPGC